jgi:threonine dehydrogenase-like Zn-dependent dehydrogenase
VNSIVMFGALYLSDVMCTSLCGVDAGKVKKGVTVCVRGLGPIGLATCRRAQIYNAKRVVAVDLVPERSELVDVVDQTSCWRFPKKVMTFESNVLDSDSRCQQGTK